jgi:hypothetical protein
MAMTGNLRPRWKPATKGQRKGNRDSGPGSGLDCLVERKRLDRVALFRGKDANLPPPTQLYQVALPVEGWRENPEKLEGTELETLLRRYEGEPSWEGPIQWGEGIETEDRIFPTRFLLTTTIKPIQWRDKWRDHLKLLAEVYEVNRLILDTKADDDDVTCYALDKLDLLIGEYLPRGLGVRHPAGHFLYLPHEPQNRRFKASQIESRDLMKSHMSYLSAHALGELEKAVRADGSVSRCPECRNAFLVTRSGQIFCSHRCANRAGMRRRRRQSNGELVSSKIIDTMTPAGVQ